MPLTADPKLTIRDLLIAQWVPGNTSYASVPRIHTGWINMSWDEPQITVTDPLEFPSGGGETGFRGINSGSGLGSKAMLGNVTVGCWSYRDEESANAAISTVNPKVITFEMAEEVRRIIGNNLLTAGGGLEWVSWTSKTERVDQRADPVLFRYDNEVRYYYCL